MTDFNSISNDRPINNEEEDIFNRHNLVKCISDVILKNDKNNSLVIGLYGSWGSGKTSIVNLIKHQLKDDVYCISFNPWLFSTQDNLTRSFFNQILSCFENNKKKVIKCFLR